MKIRYSIIPILRTDKLKLNGHAPIHYRVILNSVLVKIPTGKEILPEHWDNENNRVRKSLLFSGEINQAIKAKSEEFQRFMLKQEAGCKPITKETVKDFFNNRTNMSFYQFWEQQVGLWRVQKKHNTIRSYNAVLNVLKGFRSNLQFNELNLHLVEEFDTHLREVRLNSINGAFGSHKCFKAIIGAAIRKGFVEKNPYSDFSIRSTDSKRVFLVADELKKLKEIEIPENKQHLARIRDLFLFSCYSGIRFSDMVDLRWNNITETSICLNMNKTNKEVNIGLIPQTRLLLDKYRPSGESILAKRVFPTVSNQKSNQALVNLMKLAGIQKHISFHCARHTFASLLLSSNAQVIHIRDLLGHAHLAQTEIYARSIKSDLSEAMNKLAEL